jgi:hypothetical protein
MNGYPEPKTQNSVPVVSGTTGIKKEKKPINFSQ